MLALVGAIVQFFYLPFAFAPVALACFVIAIIASPKYRGLYQLTAVLLATGFIVGASFAVLTDNPLY